MRALWEAPAYSLQHHAYPQKHGPSTMRTISANEKSLMYDQLRTSNSHGLYELCLGNTPKSWLPRFRSTGAFAKEQPSYLSKSGYRATSKFVY